MALYYVLYIPGGDRRISEASALWVMFDHKGLLTLDFNPF